MKKTKYYGIYKYAEKKGFQTGLVICNRHYRKLRLFDKNNILIEDIRLDKDSDTFEEDVCNVIDEIYQDFNK